MYLIDFNGNDMEKVKELHEKFSDFPFPDLSSSLYFVRKKVIDGNGKIQGIILCRLTSETILIPNFDLPKTIRAKAFMDLFPCVTKEMDMKGMDETLIFVMGNESEESIEFYKKRLGFIECKGHPLVKQWR